MQLHSATRASPCTTDRQATLATGASPHVALNSQTGRQATPAARASPQAVGRQASPVDSALSQTESMVSQAGNPPSYPADSALSQAESKVSQAGNPQAAPAVRCLARLRALHASQNSNSQAGSSQAGNTPWQTVLSLSQIAKPPSQALPRPMVPRWLAVLVPRKQGLPPSQQVKQPPGFFSQGGT